MSAATVPIRQDQQQPEPLWPVPIEVLGLTGEYASGKTLFGLTICPGPQTLVYDTEKSAASYESALQFHRVDLPAIAVKKHPNGYKPIDLFQLWHAHIRTIKPGQYRVIMLDTVSEIESGLVAYVRQHPQEFGYSTAQFAKAEALVWSAVKEHWKTILSDLSSRCETFVFVAHMRDEFSGGRPTGKRSPKGKETLMELASLYLAMDRKADKKGNVPAIPSADLLKSRLVSMKMVGGGEIQMVPSLPPRIPKCTPAEIRKYILNPPDYDKLTAAERIHERVATEEEIEAMKLARATAEKDAEAMRMERLTRIQQREAAMNSPRQVPACEPTSVVEVAKDELEPENESGEPETSQDPEPDPPHNEKPAGRIIDDPKASNEQLDSLLALRRELESMGMPATKYKDILARRGVTTARNLTVEQADDLIQKMRALAIQMKAEKGQEVEVQPEGN